MVVKSDVVLQCDVCKKVVKYPERLWSLRAAATPYAGHGEMLYDEVRENEMDACGSCVKGLSFPTLIDTNESWGARSHE